MFILIRIPFYWNKGWCRMMLIDQLSYIYGRIEGLPESIFFVSLVLRTKLLIECVAHAFASAPLLLPRRRPWRCGEEALPTPPRWSRAWGAWRGGGRIGRVGGVGDGVCRRGGRAAGQCGFCREGRNLREGRGMGSEGENLTLMRSSRAKTREKKIRWGRGHFFCLSLCQKILTPRNTKPMPQKLDCH
jgi:hypothetical protein